MRLSHRLTLVFSLFGLAIAGGFQYTRIRNLRAQSYVVTRDMADGTAAAVQALVEDESRAGDFSTIGRNLQRVIRRTGIATIVVLDKKGRRLVGRSDDVGLTTRQPHPGVPIELVDDGVYDVERPVDLGPRGRGVVEVGFRTDRLEARLRQIGAEAVREGAMATLAIGFLAWFIGMWFGRQLERIVPRIEALPKDPEAFRPLRLPASAGDEVARLVAAFNRLGASLKAETSQRRELERERRELSAMLVHDLKTPLTVISSGITLLREQMGEAVVPSRREAVPARGARRTFELLEMSTQRLRRMVEDVIQLARLEEVSGLRERAPVDLAAMAAACVKDFELVCSERGQKISARLPKGAVPEVPGDAALLRRVLDNLVHNAVEHTPSGGMIRVAVAVEGARVRVSVSDSGPGVPPEARAEIFRKFFQKDVKRYVGNVGLGLAFCEKVVLRHDGAIGIEDAKPRGARFYFELPATQSELL